MRRANLVETSIREFKKNLGLAKERKEHLEKYLQKLYVSYVKEDISFEFYTETLHTHRDGKTIEQWIDYYEDYILEHQELIKKSRKESIKKLALLIFFSAFLFLAFTALVYIQPEFTGFAVQEQGEIIAGTDSFVNQNAPNNNYGNNNYIIVSEGSGKYTAGLVKFDVNNIPSSATINSAKLRLYFNHSLNNPPNSINISARRITSDWEEGTVTWNNRPSSINEDQNNIILTDNSGWIEWDVTNSIKGWTNNSYTNYGLAIAPETEVASTDKRFVSSDNPNSSLHPILEINYTYGQDWIIEGNAVYINDSRAYIRAEPHTLSSSGWVEFNITSKIYEGDIDIIFGFNTTNARPKNIEYYKPHNVTQNTTQNKIFYNVTSFTNSNANCDYGYEYNAFKKEGIYSEPIYTGSEITDWVENSSVVCYDSFVQSGNNYTLTWNQTSSQVENFIDKTSTMESVDYDFGGMNKWWFAKNVSINKNQNYMFRGYIEITNSRSGKYWFAIKPSSETIQEAISNDRLYFLDPWWNIIKVEHLDENRNFISEIYEEVKKKENNWSEVISSGEYIRITFNKNLSEGFNVGMVGVHNPISIALDPRDNSSWVTDNVDNFVYHFDSSGNSISGGFDTSAAGSYTPNGIAFDPRDNSFWVVDWFNDHVYHFDSSGNNLTDGFYIGNVDDFYTGISEPGIDPVGIALDPRDNSFWITDEYEWWVYHFDSSGNNIAGGFDTSAAGSQHPYGISFDESDNSFWVTDPYDNYVYHFDSSGNVQIDGFACSLCSLIGETDIIIYPRIVSGSPKINVYEAGENKTIAEFTSLNNEEYNKINLNKLQGNQNVFDLQIVGGSVEFDHIIDPPISLQEYLEEFK